MAALNISILNIPWLPERHLLSGKQSCVTERSRSLRKQQSHRNVFQNCPDVFYLTALLSGTQARLVPVVLNDFSGSFASWLQLSWFSLWLSLRVKFIPCFPFFLSFLVALTVSMGEKCNCSLYVCCYHLHLASISLTECFSCCHVNQLCVVRGAGVWSQVTWFFRGSRKSGACLPQQEPV